MINVDVTPLIYSLAGPAIAPVKFYEIPPEGAAYPYVQIGQTVARNRDFHDGGREIRLIYLSIWSDSPSQAEISALQDKLYVAIHRYRGKLLDESGNPSGDAVQITVQDQIVRPEPDGKTYMGQTVLKVITTHA